MVTPAEDVITPEALVKEIERLRATIAQLIALLQTCAELVNQPRRKGNE